MEEISAESNRQNNEALGQALQEGAVFTTEQAIKNHQINTQINADNMAFATVRNGAASEANNAISVASDAQNLRTAVTQMTNGAGNP